MKSWNYQPAKDIELKPVERARSLKRESGIWSTCGHLAWHSLVRVYTSLYHRLDVEGREHLPSAPPFVLIANHTSHLDSLVMGSALSCRLCDCVFPVAAGDVFFESPARSLFSAQMINALPMWRKNCGPHALAELKDRLVSEPCGYILFPEGTRSRDGSLQHFKAGLGMIVAGTPVPVVPCSIAGASRAWPPGSRWPRPWKVRLTIGPRSISRRSPTPARAGNRSPARPKMPCGGWGTDLAGDAMVVSDERIDERDTTDDDLRTHVLGVERAHSGVAASTEEHAIPVGQAVPTRQDQGLVQNDKRREGYGEKADITAYDPHQVRTRKSSLVLQRPEGPQELAEDLLGNQNVMRLRAKLPEERSAWARSDWIVPIE